MIVPDDVLQLADFGISTIIPPGQTCVADLACGTKVLHVVAALLVTFLLQIAFSLSFFYCICHATHAVGLRETLKVCSTDVDSSGVFPFLCCACKKCNRIGLSAPDSELIAGFGNTETPDVLGVNCKRCKCNSTNTKPVPAIDSAIRTE